MLEVRQTQNDDKQLAVDIFEFYSRISGNSALIQKSFEEIEQVVLGGLSFVAFIGEKVVGFVTFRNWPDYVEPMTLIVDLDYRRIGIGGKLLSKMFATFRRDFKEKTITAFPNELSISLILENGLVQQDRDQIPQFLKEVYSDELADPKFDHVLFATSVS